MSIPKLTRDVAALLNISTLTVHNLIRTGRLAEPARDSSNRYVWTAQNIEAARVALTIDRRRREHRQEARHGQ